MSRRFDCADPAEREHGLTMATSVIKRGGLVVLPTDTVYGVAADAFSPDAVGDLLAAKGRDRRTPVPVMVPSPTTLMGILEHVSDDVSVLVDAFWPGGLTIVDYAAPSLAWDLGDTGGTVSVRMPLHPVALELLRRTGPLAVMSANSAGMPPPCTAQEADENLGQGSAIEVLLDGGPSLDSVTSTIVDLTGDVPLLVREGAVDADALREFVPELEVME